MLVLAPSNISIIQLTITSLTLNNAIYTGNSQVDSFEVTPKDGWEPRVCEVSRILENVTFPMHDQSPATKYVIESAAYLPGD